jgi:hypothetical protein
VDLTPRGTCRPRTPQNASEDPCQIWARASTSDPGSSALRGTHTQAAVGPQWYLPPMGDFSERQGCAGVVEWGLARPAGVIAISPSAFSNGSRLVPPQCGTDASCWKVTGSTGAARWKARRKDGRAIRVVSMPRQRPDSQNVGLRVPDRPARRHARFVMAQRVRECLCPRALRWACSCRRSPRL